MSGPVAGTKNRRRGSSRITIFRKRKRYMPSDIGREALIPNPRLTAFQPLIGTWTTGGHRASLPRAPPHGRTGVEWHEGGAFVGVRSEIDEPKIPSGIAIFGDDDQAEGLT